MYIFSKYNVWVDAKKQYGIEQKKKKKEETDIPYISPLMASGSYGLPIIDC